MPRAYYGQADVFNRSRYQVRLPYVISTCIILGCKPRPQSGSFVESEIFISQQTKLLTLAKVSAWSLAAVAANWRCSSCSFVCRCQLTKAAMAKITPAVAGRSATEARPTALPGTVGFGLSAQVLQAQNRGQGCFAERFNSSSVHCTLIGG